MDSYKEKRKTRIQDQEIPLEEIAKTWPMIIERRTALAHRIGRNRIGLFLYTPGGRSGTQEREQDEMHEAKEEEAHKKRWDAACSSYATVKQKVHAEKEKEKDEELAPALRVSKRSLGVLVENYPDARENCLPEREK